jgi:predicted AlkP superfamily phosphohydrolase/phosphomutase
LKRTVLIGWDGATFDVLEPYWQSEVMPFLAEFVRRGVRAELTSVIPPLTPAAWTSCITGQSPARHGIFDFARINRESEVTYRWATSTDIRCETVWSIVNRHGLRVTSLNFPLTLPPPDVNGYLIPAFVPPRHLRRNVRPREFYDQLVALPGFDAKALAFDLDRERTAIQLLSEHQYEEWILFHIRREEKWLDVFRHLIQSSPCDLMAVLFDGPDKLQHACWRFIDPLLPADDADREIRDLCRAYFRRLDAILAEIVDLAGEESSIIIVSDHGFGPTEEIFYVNSWLASEGFLAWRPDVPVDLEGRMVLTDTTRNPALMFDLSKTRAFSMSSGGNGIYLNVRTEEYAGFSEYLRRRLLSFKDPQTGQTVVTRVLTREEAFPGLSAADRDIEAGEAPDLVLQLRDGGFVSILRSEQTLARREHIMGTHRPNGVFAAAGPGVRRNASLAPLSILDVAPLLLYTLGLPIPADLEGRFPSEVFEAAVIRDAAPRVGPHTVRPGVGIAKLEPAAKALIAQRLRALGYID